MVLERVADKWAVLVLGRIDDEAVRFNQLRREIQGISQKILSQALKKLERDGLIRSEVGHSAGKGRIFDHAAWQDPSRHDQGLARWAKASIEALLEAQCRYDAT